MQYKRQHYHRRGYHKHLVGQRGGRGRMVLFFVLGFLLLLWLGVWRRPLVFDEPLVVQEGDVLYTIVADQSWASKLGLRLYMTVHAVTVDTIHVGQYPAIDGRVSKQDFFGYLTAGPEQDWLSVTLLEGWSSWDVDDFLVAEGLIEQGTYRAAVTDQRLIAALASDFPFLEELDSLEGFLYPETYYVDLRGDVVENLIRMQLQTYAERISPLFAGYRGSLSPYDQLILASVVEKEERVAAQRVRIAGVFANRLMLGMRLDADISLCYGLDRGYDGCTPAVIVEHLYDASNEYNTRQVGGLPPTPIVSPTVSSVAAVLAPEQHDFLYYLHDNHGRLHMAVTYADHNQNKAQRLD